MLISYGKIRSTKLYFNKKVFTANITTFISEILIATRYSLTRKISPILKRDKSKYISRMNLVQKHSADGP